MHKLQEDTCLYIITEKRPVLLARLLRSVSLSSYLPAFICVVTPDKDTPSHFDVAFSATILRSMGARVDFVGCEPETGLSARKNIALEYMQVFDCSYGLAVDDDMVFEFYAIQHLLQSLRAVPELFAVGPVVLHEDKTGLPKNQHTWQEKIATVEDGIWKWGGHRQGVVPVEDEVGYARVQHLAGVYMHRLDDNHQYDVTYDRPVFFLYDSDFLFGKKLIVVRHAIVHHWPATTGNNLQDTYAEHEQDILENAKYFAHKHGLGEVTSMSWAGYVKPESV